MKKSDWTMIIFVAIVTGFVTFMITNSIMGDERKPSESVKTTVVFSDAVAEPNQFVFRVSDSSTDSAINPTVPITTGSGVATSSGSCEKELGIAVMYMTVFSTDNLKQAISNAINNKTTSTKESLLSNVDDEVKKINEILDGNACSALAEEEKAKYKSEYDDLRQKSKQIIEEAFKDNAI
jgi:hypothetical protein